MTKLQILANIATKIKSKVGLINKTELGEVQEDIVNEVYSDVIVQPYFGPYNYATKGINGFEFALKFKKTGNIMYIYGELFAPSGMGSPVTPVINLLDSNLHPLDDLYFDLIAVNQSGISSKVTFSSASNKIFFNYAMNPDDTLFFSGSYVTN